MTIKMIVFDVDGTIAKTEEAISSHICERLRSLESKGIMLVFMSGRTASYLAGLARGIGIVKPLVSGENGGVIFDPINFWEKRFNGIPYDIITEMKQSLINKFDDLWFQPNQTMMTAAPRDRSRIEELCQTVKDLKPVREHDYKLQKYDDSVEVMSKENNKGAALAVIRNLYHIQKHEVIAVGNTEVDLPMRHEVREFLFIGDSIPEPGIRSYRCIDDALDYLEDNLKFNKSADLFTEC